MRLREDLEPATGELARLRASLEVLDAAIVEIIARRCGMARTLADAKRAAGLPLFDPAREAAVVRRAGALARELAIDEETVRRVFWSIIELTRRLQEEVRP